MHNEIIIPLCLFFIAFLYSIVGHGGASGYSAILALFGIAMPSLRVSILILNIAVSLIGFTRFSLNKQVNFKILLPLLVFSVPCAYLGGKLEIDKAILELSIGFVLVISAIITIVYEYLLNLKQEEKLAPPKLLLKASTGSILGFLSGITGIGGGVFLSPLMLHLNWARLKEISGIAAGFILFNSIAGLLGQLNNQISLPNNFYIWVIAVILGGLLGSWLGVQKFSNKAIKLCLAIIVLTAGLKLIF